jgi:hypothetical protein
VVTAGERIQHLPDEGSLAEPSLGVDEQPIGVLDRPAKVAELTFPVAERMAANDVSVLEGIPHSTHLA